MNWGVVPMLNDSGDDDAQKVERAIKWGKERAYFEAGDVVVATGSSTTA